MKINVKSRFLSKLTLCLFLESMALSYLLDGNGNLLRLSRSFFLDIIDPVASEVVDFELPLLFGLTVYQVMTLLTMRMGSETYILLGSAIFKSLNELSNGHVIWLLHLVESDSCWSVEFLSNFGVGDVACLVIDFQSTKLNSDHIREVHICQIGLAWVLNKSKVVRNREILDTFKLDG